QASFFSFIELQVTFNVTKRVEATNCILDLYADKGGSTNRSEGIGHVVRTVARYKTSELAFMAGKGEIHAVFLEIKLDGVGSKVRFRILTIV
ncbi:hypothetical protein R0K18_26695, partial [Pantoea sp. SIMBA_133]